MKKIVMAVVGVALAVALTGCKKSSTDEKKDDADAGIGSPKTVAESFAKAFIQRDTDKAVELMAAFVTASAEANADKDDFKRWVKERLERQMREYSSYGDSEVSTGDEEIEVSVGYKIKNGVKIGNEKADVVILFGKGEDKEPGMKVRLGRYNGSWMVEDFDMKAKEARGNKKVEGKADKAAEPVSKKYYK